MNIRKGYNLIILCALAVALFALCDDSYSAEVMLRPMSLSQDKDRTAQIARYMYGEGNDPGKGVIVYKKYTPGEKSAQVTLPVYEISWMIENFSDKEIQAVIDSLGRWTKPVHRRLLTEIIDILVFRRASAAKVSKEIGAANLSYLSKIAAKMAEKAPYRVYFAVSESGVGDAGKIEVESFIYVYDPYYATTPTIQTLENKGAWERKERFAGLGRQMLRYVIWKELQLGSEKIKFGLGGIFDKLLKNEGINVRKVYTREGLKELEEIVLKGAEKTAGILEKSGENLDDFTADPVMEAGKEFDRAMAETHHILAEAEKVISGEKDEVVVELLLGELETKTIGIINRLHDSGDSRSILKDLNVFTKGSSNVFRDRYYDMLASAALSFPQKIGDMSYHNSSIHSIIEDEFFDMDKEYVWGIFSGHTTAPDKKSLKRVRFGIPIITQPLLTLKKVKSLQEMMGDTEVNFSVIYPQKATYPLVVIIGGGEDRARHFLFDYLLSDGHTHGFSTPLESSPQDREIAGKHYNNNKAISFILALDRGGDFELAVYNPKSEDFIYECEDQSKITETLRELHLLASKTNPLNEKVNKASGSTRYFQ
ncbi:MAG: hypothetical protein KKH08_06200 [Candidatus Omnitrophica bacterium]|nr:hypothetical protein [Candidatus Omnitrophota bacterium]